MQKKLDGSEVSEADLAANALLQRELEGARPDYGWLSESPRIAPSGSPGRGLVIDPIDGTNAFLRHNPEWTVSAALVEGSTPVIGVVYNPARQELSSRHQGSRRIPEWRPIMSAGKRASKARIGPGTAAGGNGGATTAAPGPAPMVAAAAPPQPAAPTPVAVAAPPVRPGSAGTRQQLVRQQVRRRWRWRRVFRRRRRRPGCRHRQQRVGRRRWLELPRRGHQ